MMPFLQDSIYRYFQKKDGNAHCSKNCFVFDQPVTLSQKCINPIPGGFWLGKITYPSIFKNP